MASLPADRHSRAGAPVPVSLSPVRVVTVGGRPVVLPVPIDSPERVRARVVAHNNGETTEADIIRHAKTTFMPAHFRFWKALYDSFRVLATRDGLPVTPAVAAERANNAMTALVLTFHVAELQPARTNAFAEQE